DPRTAPRRGRPGAGRLAQGHLAHPRSRARRVADLEVPGPLVAGRERAEPGRAARREGAVLAALERHFAPGGRPGGDHAKWKMTRPQANEVIGAIAAESRRSHPSATGSSG